MQDILSNENFQVDYAKLSTVSLNPERHTANNALAHCEQVVAAVEALARENALSDGDTQTLRNLALVHDIGKTLGMARPEASVNLLARYGEFDEGFVNLVKYHDINLPWYQSMQRGEAPSDSAWARLSKRVNLRLLCLFMIADRADCPGGWEMNAPLVWFLAETQRRKLVEEHSVRTV
jgi:hypothetical protein